MRHSINGHKMKRLSYNKKVYEKFDPFSLLISSETDTFMLNIPRIVREY